jgi:Kef-type K+ transport system membrane component KefB
LEEDFLLRAVTIMTYAFALIAERASTLEFLRSHLSSLSSLVKLIVGLSAVFIMPPLSRRLKLPPVVGLLAAGVVLGPYVLGIFGKERPVMDFIAELGKLLLMFYAGLEVNLALFRQSQRKVTIFGVVTTTLPLVLGTVVGLLFGYAAIPAIVLGSLLASHTLLALPIVTELGAAKLEPVAVTAGATVMSDTLSLVVFAVCVSTYQRGFSVSVLVVQLVEIVAYVLFILLVMSRVAAYAFKKAGNKEDTFFILLFGIMAISAALAGLVHLPGIVGAFLAGLALNEAAQGKPAAEKLGFFANAVFIPSFFLATGFLIDPAVLVRSLIDNFGLAVSIVLALVVGKWIAAELTGRSFRYPAPARMTVWSLTLPQVAATLAAALVGFKTLDPAGHPLIDQRILNSVFVLMLTTSILGPVLTQHYTPLMMKSYRRDGTEERYAA